MSYIPEMVWNDSGSNGGDGLWASGGGISIYYQQPTWQAGLPGTSAASGMRTVPDVAVTASGAHDGYIINENGSFYVIGGTSAASPSFAGVMALVVQSQGGTGQGNANTSLYPLVNAKTNPFHPTLTGNNSVPGVTGFTSNGSRIVWPPALAQLTQRSWSAVGEQVPTAAAVPVRGAVLVPPIPTSRSRFHLPAAHCW